MMNSHQYAPLIDAAIKHFWATRDSQLRTGGGELGKTGGNRSAVTGGKQLDGFIELLSKAAVDCGVPPECIHTKGSTLPGFFRATKNWDLMVVSPSKKLVALIELKSQVGSFGNNFNNRTEEALGVAADFWTAFRENAFAGQAAPWLGYLMVVEKSEKSVTAVKAGEPHFKVFPEFRNASYLERYRLLCKKLMLERHYSQCGLIWATADGGHGNVDKEVSIEAFLNSYVRSLKSWSDEFSN